MLKPFRYDDVSVLETTSGKLKGYFYGGEYLHHHFLFLRLLKAYNR